MNSISFNRGFSTENSTSNSSLKNNIEKRTVRILSIDGGGIRGLIPLTILDKIEKSLKSSISQKFDIIAGTSTGGIVALALNVTSKKGGAAHSAESLKELYLKENETIFSQPNMLQRYCTPMWNVFFPKYSTKALEKLLNQKFEDALLSESRSTVLVTACDLRNAGLHVFNSYEALKIHEKNYYMKDIAMATSAAPTYFDPHKVLPHYRGEDGRIVTLQAPLNLIDGGIAVNNPTFLAYSYARTFFPEANDYVIVSLGTGTRTVGFTRYHHLKGTGFFGWARKLPRLMINASSSAVEHYIDVLRFELARNPNTTCRYYPFRPELPEDLSSMDSTNKTKNKDLIDYATNLIDSDPYKTQLNNLLKELNQKRSYAYEGGILRPGFSLTKEANDYVSVEELINSINVDITADIGLQRKPLNRGEVETIKRELMKKLRSAEINATRI